MTRIERLYDQNTQSETPERLYEHLVWPEAWPDRPYAMVNMAATLDGRTVVSPEGKGSEGIGSATDRMLVKRLRASADAVLLGAATVRACPVAYAAHLLRVVVSGSGDLPVHAPFFATPPMQTLVLVPRSLSGDIVARLADHARVERSGTGQVNLGEAARLLRERHGVRRLLIEGGGSLNAQALAAGIVDEVFVTFAPSISFGLASPGVSGAPHGVMPGLAGLSLVSAYRCGSELFLRYRVLARDRGGAADGP